MDITAETLQAFLDDAWDAAPNEANTLRDQLRVFEKSATSLFRQGSIGSVSKNSASQSYRGPGVGSYTPVQIANSWRHLINLFDDIKAAIVSLDDADVATDTDETIYAQMKLQLRAVTEFQTDISGLRLPPTLAPQEVA